MFKTLFAAATLAFAIAGSASASVWNFSYTTDNGPSGVETASGQVTLSDTLDSGHYDILNIVGIADGLAINGLSGYAAADNDVFPTGPYVDFGGVSFHTVGGPDFNIFFNGGAYYVISSAIDSVGYPQSGSLITSASFSAAPESATWLLMIAGIGGAGLMLRRARSTQKTAGALAA